MSNDEPREVPRDEWKEARAQRERERDAMQTPGPDWDMAREAFLRNEWLRKPVELRHNQTQEEWVEIGQKIGVPDSEVLRAGVTLLEQAKRDLPPHLAEALARVMPMAKPKPIPKRDRRTQAEITGAACMVLKKHPSWTTQQIAEAIQTSPKRLTPKAAPEFKRMREAQAIDRNQD